MWSIQPLSTNIPVVFHWVRAAQFFSSGLAKVGPITEDSCLPPFLCLLYVLSRWIFSQHLMHCAVSYLFHSLAKCSVIPHTTPFLLLGPFLKSRFTASSKELSCIKNFHTSLAECWVPTRWRGSLRLLPLLAVALWATPVIQWRSCPNTQNPQAPVQQARLPKAPLSASPRSEISHAKALEPLLQFRRRLIPHNNFSSAWELLHLE